MLVPALLLALIAIPFGIYWSELPDPMAVHWGLSGEPNGSMPPALAALLLAGIYLAVVVSVRRVVSRAPGDGPSFVAGSFAIGAILACVSWVSVLANRNVESWTAASEVGWFPFLVGLIAIAAVVGSLGWLLAGGSAASRRPSGEDRPTLDLTEPESVVWSGRGIGRVTTAIAVGVIVVALAIWGWPGLVLLVVGLIALLFAVVRVTVSQRGVVVSLGWWGFPAWRVPMEGISHAEVEKVNPMAYGGWGYRVRPGARAVVVRGGDSLRLVRQDATDLVYTVDDAATGAGLLNAILGARKD